MFVRLFDDVVCMGATIASKMTQLRIGGSNVRERRILLAGVFTLGSRIANLLVTMVTVPLTYNYLSQERFGMLMTIMSFISVMSFSDFAK